MKRFTALLTGVSLLASHAMAGNVSGVAGTLDTSLVDPAPSLYPHFICASGCGVTGAVSQAGPWSVSISNLPSVQSVAGSVSISNLPATQLVGGSVAVPGVAAAANQPALSSDGGSLSHVTNFPTLQSVTGAVSITNLPANQAVSGSVAVSNLPTVQAVTVANQPALNSDGGSLSHVTNFPTLQSVTGAVSITNLPATQAVSGSVAVSNLPAVQAVTVANQPALNSDGGSLSHITNFPTLQSVTGAVSITNLPATQPVSGSVAVSNLPAVQSVSGSVTVANLPATQPISGSVAVTNFPGTQPISTADGLDATLGGKSDTQCASIANPCSAIAVLKAMLAASSSPIPTQGSSISIGGVGLLAGSAKVGQVAIDQTTPGVTNTVQQSAMAPVFSIAAESCHVLKNAPGLLASVSGYAGQAEFIMVFNTAAAPADTTNPAPVAVGYAGAAGFWALNWTSPLSLSTGITVCDSSTGPLVKTAISTNNTFSGQVQ